jgi:protein SCO1/2
MVRMTPSRSLPWLIAAAALAGALGLYFGQRYFTPAASMQSVPTKTALVYPQARQLGDFLLERADGRALTLADWRGHWNLVFIGFTHCPDVCPQALAVFREIEKKWPTDAGAPPALYFVSVDPERDSAKILADYAGYFSKSIIAATGAHDRLEPFTRQLGMVYMKSPQPSGDYTVDHSADLALIGPDATQVALFRAPLDPDAIIADLVALQSVRAATD